MLTHHCGCSVDESKCIDEVELVDAEHDLVGKHDACSRDYVEQNVQDCLYLVA